MKCWHCNKELIWGGDHDIEEENEDPMTWSQIYPVPSVTLMWMSTIPQSSF